MSRKGIQAKSVNNNVWAETFYNFYVLYKSLDMEYSKTFDNLPDLTKRTKLSSLEMTVSLIKYLVLRKENVQKF